MNITNSIFLNKLIIRLKSIKYHTILGSSIKIHQALISALVEKRQMKQITSKT